MRVILKIMSLVESRCLPFSAVISLELRDLIHILLNTVVQSHILRVTIKSSSLPTPQYCPDPEAKLLLDPAWVKSSGQLELQLLIYFKIYKYLD